jgi:hypothetical protein
MDIPDRVIEEEYVWTFDAIVLSEFDPGIQYQWMNPVQLFASGKLVGVGNLRSGPKGLVAQCIADYAIPERLDVEAGNKVYVLPRVEVFPVTLGSRLPYTVIDIQGLELSHQCTDPEVEPITLGPVL